MKTRLFTVVVTALILMTSHVIVAQVSVNADGGLPDNSAILDAKSSTKVDALDKKIDSKVDGLRSEMNARFDQLFNFLWAFIGIFTAMMVSVFGFAFWDRKLSLAPMKAENLKTLNALREFAEHQPKLREILKNAGLM